MSRFDYLSSLLLSLTCVFLFCFVLSFISCCSIFKDHRLLAACSCDLFIISHFLAFVKGFCKSFLSFFLNPFASPFLGFAWLQPLYYITFSSVCQVVLIKYLNLFSKPLGSLPLLTRPVYYIILQKKIKHQFKQIQNMRCVSQDAVSLGADDSKPAAVGDPAAGVEEHLRIP